AVLPHGNRLELQLDRGSAELTWVSPSSFHFRRSLDGPLRPNEDAAHEAVAFTTEGSARDVRLRTRHIEVTISKQGLKLAVKKTDGTPLMIDLSAPRREP